MNEVKITLVGDTGTGKTSLLRCLDGYGFEERCNIKKCDVFTKYVVVNNCSYMLELRDTIGGEDFESGRDKLYKDTDIFFLCFADDNPISFKNVLVKWHTEIKKFRPKATTMLICTKSDLRSKQILSNEIIEVKKKIRAVQFVCCSAKTGQNVKEIFEQAISNVFDIVPKTTTLLPKFLSRSNSTTY